MYYSAPILWGRMASCGRLVIGLLPTQVRRQHRLRLAAIWASCAAVGNRRCWDIWQWAPHQNVALKLVVTVRIPFTAAASPNSGLVTVVFNCVTTT